MVTTVVAAGLIATTANTVSYAAGGPSVLLGKSNASAKTTTLKSKSNKPPLALKGGKKPLTVSSTGKVKNLNADRVDGKDAADLEPTTGILEFGTADGALPSYYADAVDVGPGTYQVQLNLAVRTESTPSNEVSCYVFPNLQVLADDNYTSLVGDSTSDTFAVLNASGIVTVEEDDTLVFGCDGSAASYTLWSPGRLSVQPLTAVGTLDRLEIAEPPRARSRVGGTS